jgi:hypothetical protein
VDGEFGRWKGEDQPAATGVDRPGAEHLAKACSGCVDLVAVEDGMGAVAKSPGLLSRSWSEFREVEVSTWSSGSDSKRGPLKRSSGRDSLGLALTD